jgi:hypothetical protein
MKAVAGTSVDVVVTGCSKHCIYLQVADQRNDSGHGGPFSHTSFRLDRWIGPSPTASRHDLRRRCPAHERAINSATEPYERFGFAETEDCDDVDGRSASQFEKVRLSALLSAIRRGVHEIS